MNNKKLILMTAAEKKLNSSFKKLEAIYDQSYKEHKLIHKILYKELQKTTGRINITDISGPGHYYNEKVIKISKKFVFYCTIDGKVTSKYPISNIYFFQRYSQAQLIKLLERIQKHIK